MELFRLQTSPCLELGEGIQPVKFKHVLAQGAKEKDLEDLIVKYPSVLNWSELESFDISDLLIIDRQSVTDTRKRADLFAISTFAELVVIEIKRDAEDAKARREGIEFQAIRYAASSSKMTASEIIEMFANYLKSLAAGEKMQHDSVYRIHAIEKLCEHLADADEELTETDLQDLLNPKEKQKIYLVAAGYDPDALSARAWLRAHDVDISCFQLCPYKVCDQLFLERQRVIPPPHVDDFLVGMRSSTGGAFVKHSATSQKQKCDKPTTLKWENNAGTPQAVETWKDTLVEGTKKALDLGLVPDALPMRHSVDGNGTTDFYNPAEIRPGLTIETHGNSKAILGRLSKMFEKLGKPKGFLQIVTQSGKTYDVPEKPNGLSKAM